MLEVMRLEKKIEKLTLPVWRGELYFERHRGTLTSIAKNKRNNRRAEFAAMNAEWLCEESALLCGAEYPKALFDGAWKKILNMQFHDILPGSCIGAVYEETDALYAEVFAELGRAAEAAAAEIGACLPAGYMAAVVNPNGFRTDAYVHTGEGCRLVRGPPPKSIVPLCAEPVRGSVSVSERALENTFVSVRFAPDYTIASVFDKRCGRELLRPGRRANVLQAFDNHAVYEFDAWELKTYFDKKGWEIDDVSEVKLLDDGARKGVYIRRRYLSSEVRQTVWLYEESPRIEFETQADWREPHTIVKALFPVDINAEYVTRDIAFGRCDTPVHAKMPWDQERFEICAHKYCDLREGDYGVALLSDCKYGYDFRDGMRLTLFKTASFPFPEADIGRHDFTYALFPHGSDPLYTQVLREATLLNNPPYLQKVIGKGARGAFDPAAGFVSCNGGNVVLETVKCAENGELCAGPRVRLRQLPHAYIAGICLAVGRGMEVRPSRTAGMRTEMPGERGRTGTCAL